MKSQMRFQKILMTVTLIIAALSIVYAVIFCSGIINQLGHIHEDIEGGMTLYKKSQSFSDTFLILGIVLVLTVVLMMIMGCHTRRKYYITNYIAIGIFVVYAIVFAILLVVNVAGVSSAINAINLEEAKEAYEEAANYYGEWNDSTWMLTLGYVYMGILLVNVAAVILNLVLKIKLMQGEKALLESSVAKEAA